MEDVFGAVNSVKLCSCLTFFAIAGPVKALFHDALNRLCDGQTDATTLAMRAQG